MKVDESMRKAIRLLAEARSSFDDAVKEGLILGNDNHIGDIGEYWVKRHLVSVSKFHKFAPKKNSPYDIEMTDGNKISVKTITAWSKNGYGTQVKPLCGNRWQVLAAVSLNADLYPEKIALVHIDELVTKEPFQGNALRRANKKTKAFPRFEWWGWLNDYVVYSQ